MSKTKQAQSAAPYVRRLVEDKYIHEQLRGATAGVETVYRHVRRRGGKATEDKRLYGDVRQAATSLRNAIVPLARSGRRDGVPARFARIRRDDGGECNRPCICCRLRASG